MNDLMPPSHQGYASRNAMQDNASTDRNNSLSDALADYFDRPAHPPNTLPEHVHGLVHRIFILGPLGPGYWIDLTPAKRRATAAKWDRANMDEAIFASSFTESVNNGKPISWFYWVEQMPVWTSAQAARLICALDPDIFEDLTSRSNENAPSDLTLKAKQIQRLAEAQGKDLLSPAMWLEWADSQRLKVHVGLRIEVNAMLKSIVAEPIPIVDISKPIEPNLEGSVSTGPVQAGSVLKSVLHDYLEPAVTPSQPNAPENTKAKGKGGRPKSIEKKAAILRNLIEIMLDATVNDASALRGSAADLLDACQRIEKVHTKKSVVFGGVAPNTFNMWLRHAGYGIKAGRTPADEGRYWTNLLPKVMGKVPGDVFVLFFTKYA